MLELSTHNTPILIFRKAKIATPAKVLGVNSLRRKALDITEKSNSYAFSNALISTLIDNELCFPMSLRFRLYHVRRGVR